MGCLYASWQEQRRSHSHSRAKELHMRDHVTNTVLTSVVTSLMLLSAARGVRYFLYVIHDTSSLLTTILYHIIYFRELYCVQPPCLNV